MLFHFLLLCVLGIVCGQDNDRGEYGRYTTWRKAVCDKNDEELNKDLDTCFSMEKNEVTEAAAKCINNAMDSEVDLVTFINVGCKDIQIFHKFDECIDEYKSNPDFKLKPKVTAEVMKCYGDILEKYGMESFKAYFLKYSE